MTPNEDPIDPADSLKSKFGKTRPEDGQGITCSEYQEKAIETAFFDCEAISYCTLGINGELAEAGLSCPVHGFQHLLKECGDVLWYVSVLASQLDIDLNDVATGTIRLLCNKVRPENFDSLLALYQADQHTFSDLSAAMMLSDVQYSPDSYGRNWLTAHQLAGEISEAAKKYLRDDKPIDTEGVTKNLAGILFVLVHQITSVSFSIHGKSKHSLSFRTVAEHNLKKLASRKERGKLSGDGDDR